MRDPFGRRPLVEVLLGWIMGLVLLSITLQILLELFTRWVTTAAPFILIALLVGVPGVVWWKRRSYY